MEAANNLEELTFKSIYNETIVTKHHVINATYDFSRNGYVNKRGERSIVLRYYIDKKYLEMKTNMYSKEKNIMDLSNTELEVLEKLLYEGRQLIFQEILQGKPFKSLKELKYAIQHKTIKTAKFTDFGHEWLKHSSKADGTKSNYRSLIKIVEKFDKDLKVTDLDFDKGQQLIKFFETSGVSKKSIASKIGSIKTVLRAAEKLIGLNESTFHNIEIKMEKSEKKEFISEQNLEKIEKATFENKMLERVRDIFLLAVYCGLRFSDIKTLKTCEIIDGWIEKIMKKTNKQVNVPVKDLFDGKFFKIIEKYGSIENLVSDMGENGAFNAKLKEVFKECGLQTEAEKGHWTFHISRHTFATLLLEKGLGTVTIQKLLGHTKLGTTMNVYAEVTKNVIKNDLKNLKKKK